MMAVMAEAKPRHIESHTALRGIAALTVVGYHLPSILPEGSLAAPLLAPFSRAYLAVDLFFVLSGFVLTYVYGRQGRGLDLGGTKDFLIARIARVYPLHLATMIGVLLLAAVVGMRPPGSGEIAAHLTMTHAWGFWDHVGLNYPSWSISAEFFAYLLFPLLLAVRTRAPLAFVCTAVALSLAFYGSLGVESGTLTIETGLALVRCVAGFMLGMALAGGTGRLAAWSDGALGALQVLVVSLIAAGFAFGLGDVLFMPLFVALVALTVEDRGVVASLLRAKPLLWLGLVSYSVYLLHVPVIRGTILVHAWVLARLPEVDPAGIASLVFVALVFVLTVAGAGVTYWLIEEPGRKLARRRPRPVVTAAP